ncbi:MAG: translocation/assembly module TamB domain-containing protein [Lewinellaceae bacterium]|nr:translocation/assembly module TamB domain-containing protein [Lewinellaceae bacterium]
MQENTENQEQEKRSRWRSLAGGAWRWLKRIVGISLILFLVLSLILQIPAVQNWAAQRITSYLGKAMQTTVSIDRLNIIFLDRLILEGFYVEGLTPGDTAIYSKRLYANISLNPITYLRRGLVVEEAELDSATVNIRKAEGAYQTNIQILLGRLLSPDTTAVKKEEKKPFNLSLDKLSLRSVQFLKEDQENGQVLSVFLQEGALVFDEVNLPGNFIHTRSVVLKQPYISIASYPEKPLPPLGEAEQTPAADEAGTEEGLPFYATIGSFRLEGGKFSLHNYRNAPQKLTPIDELDFQHLEVYDINIGIDNFSFCSDSLDFEGQVRQLALRDESGFVLDNLSAEEARVWNKGVTLNGLKLKTPYSTLGDTLTFRYSSYEAFKDFPSRVRMGLYLNDASVTLRDIMTFAPGLNQNTFFSLNRNRKVFLDGLIKGRVNSLDGENLLIALEDNSLIVEGGFSSHDLTVRRSESMNLNLARLKTSMGTLRQLIPNFNPPPNFDRLGRLNFSGRFDGYFLDFVAYGELSTTLGKATMDMRMDLKNGRERANYSGKLALIDFDLGGWAQNPDFGLVNFTSEVKDGVGLSLETVRASLNAKVQSFVFKGYNYQNANLSGELKKNLFRGDFAIQDDNVDFSFLGTVDLTDSLPAFNFNATVNKLDLKQLNLAQQDIILSGKVQLDVKNSRLSDMEGGGRIQDLVIRHSKLGRTVIDSVSFRSQFVGARRKLFTINSDVADVALEGAFDIEQVPAAFTQYLARNYPEFFNRLRLKAPEKQIGAYAFSFDARIYDTKNLLALADGKLAPIQNGVLEGYFDNTRDSISLSMYLPQFKYDKIALNDLGLDARLEKSAGKVDLIILEPVLNDKTHFSKVTMLGILKRDTFEWGLNYESEGMSILDLDELNLNAQIFMPDSLNFRMEFTQSNLVLLKQPWLINDRNFITFRKGFIDTKNFLLTSGEKEIHLEGVGKKGLKLGLYNFDFSFIDDIWDYESLDFGGRFNITAEVGDIFEMTGIKATVLADTFLINNDDWGALRLDANADNLKSPFYGYLSLTKDTAQLLAEGFFNPAAQGSGRGLADEQMANYFNINTFITGFPLAVAEYWIGSSVSNTVGSVGGNIRINGLPGDPHIAGFLTIRNGGTTVDFLNTRYTFDQALVRMDDHYLFDASDTTVKDKFGNEAKVFGGITHQKLKGLAISARMETNRFLALDTEKGDNELFYGHALGEGDVLFSGPLNKIDIYVNATVGEGTRLVIPVSYGSDASELSFINFRQRNLPNPKEDESRREEPTGVNLEMDLIITEEAQGEIVFDEQAGDVIKGQGRGNIRILVPRNGEFQMFGDYIIERGDYLFTLYNVINKEFSIKKGGVVSWSGDPFGAKIRLEAEYKDLSTSVANFIQEYLQDVQPEIKNEASKSTNVGLTMDLRGDLLQPVINFDINFPQLTGQLKTLTDNKLRLLKQDPNELNRQVFGLIVVGQFLPSDLAIQGSEIFYNTVSEFVSNQLSLLLTELFSEVFSEGSALSGIDLDIAYNQYQSVDLGEGQNISGGDEFQVRLRQEFFNDRLTILVGGNVDVGNTARATPGSSGTFVGNDLVIEYVLNQDRTVKLRVYQRLEPDIGGGSRLEIGTGLSFRREFDSFGEFIASFRRAARKGKH